MYDYHAFNSMGEARTRLKRERRHLDLTSDENMADRHEGPLHHEGASPTSYTMKFELSQDCTEESVEAPAKPLLIRPSRSLRVLGDLLLVA